MSLFGLGGIDLFILGQQQKYNYCERNGVHYAIIDGVNDNIDFEQIKIEYVYSKTARLLFNHDGDART